jgi:superfamily I DNA and/or RNA helicase
MLAASRLRRGGTLVCVGDHRQLGPTVFLRDQTLHAVYSLSLFERLIAREQRPLMLVTQYRMHPEICAFPSTFMYGGRLRDGGRPTPADAKVSSLTVLWGNEMKVPLRPYLFINTGLLCTQEIRGSSGSYSNEKECSLSVALCQALLCDGQATAAMSIGIITPYSDQKRSIIRLLERSRLADSVEVDTVDGFQGREKDVILLCCVRANSRGDVGFFGDSRRLNVALTRAKQHLFVVGDLGTLSSASPAFKALSADATQRGCVLELGTGMRPS